MEDLFTKLIVDTGKFTAETKNYMATNEKFTSKTKTLFTNNEIWFQNHDASIKNLEKQIGQTANLMSHRLQGALPTHTKISQRDCNP